MLQRTCLALDLKALPYIGFVASTQGCARPFINNEGRMSASEVIQEKAARRNHLRNSYLGLMHQQHRAVSISNSWSVLRATGMDWETATKKTGEIFYTHVQISLLSFVTPERLSRHYTTRLSAAGHPRDLRGDRGDLQAGWQTESLQWKWERVAGHRGNPDLVLWGQVGGARGRYHGV